MVKRVVLGRTPEEKVVDLIKNVRDSATAGSTTPAGNKVLEDDEDFYWSRPDGTEHSMREVDEALEGARGRIDEATADLALTQERLEGAETAVQETTERLHTVETVTLPGAVQVLEEADRQASQALTELDARLAGVDGPTGDLSAIRKSLAEAVSAVESATDVARTANEAANAASQAALEAAGIAASKGRTIIQTTEPQGDDRKASNIWIKPVEDNPDTEIEERATTYVYLADSDEWVPTTSDELAQAAQNALDAREAAQQAQQRADTAISNAATAQAAAEAAQRTADAATISARDAHNEAVAAQAEADAAKERINSGLNLVNDPSRTRSTVGWVAGVGDISIEDRDMGYGAVPAIKHQNVGHSTIYSDYFEIDPTQAYEFRLTFDKPVVNENLASDFYFGMQAVTSSRSLLPVDSVRTSDSKVSATGTNFYFWYKNGPYDGPTELVGYVLPIGVADEVVGSLGNGTYNARLTSPDTAMMRLRFLNYSNNDLDLPVWVSNVSVRAVSVEDLIRARAAQAAADAAQKAADAAYAEAEKKITAEQGKALADAAEKAAKEAAALDATAKAATAKAEATKIAADDAKAKADAAQAEATRIANSKATPEQVQAAAAEAERLAKEAAALDATAKANAAEARAATDAKAKADAALAAARADLSEARKQITAEIKASANGKNAIKISTSAPSASTPGVVVGDTWWRVDSSGNIFGQWRWTGSTWTPVQVRSEVIANLDVHKLQVTGSAKMAESVIEKLWVDGLAARAVDTARLTVSSGNLYADPGLTQQRGWGARWSATGGKSGGGSVTIEAGTSQRGGYDSLGAGVVSTRVVPGTEYLFTAQAKPSATYAGRGAVMFVRWYGEVTTGSWIQPILKSPQLDGVADTWQELSVVARAPEGAVHAVIGFYINSPYAGSAIFSDPVVRPKVGAVLIEDGAVSTPHLNVTQSMSAKIAQLMDVEAQKLIVSREAILNHTTLIGKTVVDDINVQGKLIGTDGVFTGTVDFENVNVTGTQIVNKLGANSIEASMIKGGSFEGKTFSGVSFTGSSMRTGSGSYYSYLGDIVYTGTSNQAFHGFRSWSQNGSRIDIGSGPITGNGGQILMTDTADSPSVKITGSSSDMSTGYGVQVFHKNGQDAINLFKQGEDNSRAAILLNRWDGVRGVEAWSADGTNHAYFGINDGAGAPTHRFTGNGPFSLSNGRIIVTGTDVTGPNRDTLQIRSGDTIVSMHGSGSTWAGQAWVEGKWRFAHLQANGAATTSAAANTHMVTPAHSSPTEAGRLYFSTSSRRYKRNIVDWNPSPSAVLAMRPRQWQHNDPNSPIDERWHVGFVAEEIHDLGLRGLVRYEVSPEGDYRPDGLNYERFAAAQQVVLRDHEARIADLEAENAALRDRLDRLESLITQETA